MSLLRFLIGSGWGIPWHLALYLVLLYRPLISGRELWEYTRKGSGPEGLGIFLLLMLEATYVVVFSLLDSTYYVWAQPFSLGKKAGIVLGGTVGLALLVFLCGLPLGSGKGWGWVLFNLSVVAALGVNLWWLSPRR